MGTGRRIGCAAGARASGRSKCPPAQGDDCSCQIDAASQSQTRKARSSDPAKIGRGPASASPSSTAPDRCGRARFALGQAPEDRRNRPRFHARPAWAHTRYSAWQAGTWHRPGKGDGRTPGAGGDGQAAPGRCCGPGEPARSYPVENPRLARRRPACRCHCRHTKIAPPSRGRRCDLYCSAQIA